MSVKSHAAGPMSGDDGRIVQLGEYEYRWEELVLETSPSDGWAHHGVAVLGDGGIVVCAPDQAVLIILDSSGRERSRAEIDLVEMHGIRATSTVRGEPLLWVADNGHRFLPGRPCYVASVRPGRVVALGLDGKVRRELVPPALEVYEHALWSPCAAAVDEEVYGGSGDIWVADGYGKSLLHRFSAAGQLMATLDGSESGTPFNTPHDVIIDRRRAEPELYVADRGNRRLVVFDLEGRFRRQIGSGELTSPSGLATSGDLLFVSELYGRLATFDLSDGVVGVLGTHDDHERPGWPNDLDDTGNLVPVRGLAQDAFNSPHGLATDTRGAIYVSEWLIGGRLVRLTPQRKP